MASVGVVVAVATDGEDAEDEETWLFGPQEPHGELMTPRGERVDPLGRRKSVALMNLLVAYIYIYIYIYIYVYIYIYIYMQPCTGSTYIHDGSGYPSGSRQGM